MLFFLENSLEKRALLTNSIDEYALTDYRLGSKTIDAALSPKSTPLIPFREKPILANYPNVACLRIR
ncbi:hypothetical protein CUU95_02695 [Vreelandella alkaliphila]|nr:hypothetical protein CUU95_02695 [Halomonas alkaliphila]